MSEKYKLIDPEQPNRDLEIELDGDKVISLKDKTPTNTKVETE